MIETNAARSARMGITGGFGKRDRGEIGNPPRNRKGENGNPSYRRARFLSQQAATRHGPTRLRGAPSDGRPYRNSYQFTRRVSTDKSASVHKPACTTGLPATQKLSRNSDLKELANPSSEPASC